MNTENVLIHWHGQQAYSTSWQAMQDFTNMRDSETMDQIWLLEHDPVFTQGQNGKPEHVLNPGNIPIVQTDRGGQVTYHGPGQLMTYTLIDLKRKKFTIRDIVCKLESSVIAYLSSQGIKSEAKREAPGVYVEGQKICSIGLRVRRGCVYHGIAFNVHMDLAPFAAINPCGFSDLKMIDLKSLIGPITPLAAGQQLIHFLMLHLGYNSCNFQDLT